MKIECPECGQHYEVDASMLDRHFRCTECKTFFLGINAKAVKVKKFVPKSSVADQADADVEVAESIESADVLENTAGKTDAVAADKENNEDVSNAVKLEPAKLEDDKFFDDADLNEASERYRKNKLIIIALAVGVALFTAVIAGVVSWSVGLINGAKISALEKRCNSLQEDNTSLQGRVEKLEAYSEAANAMMAAANDKTAKLEQKLTVVENNLNKINELAESVKKLESKDLELNVKILELNSEVNNLNNLIDSNDRNGTRVQRRRR